jgi:hypothetical protein
MGIQERIKAKEVIGHQELFIRLVPDGKDKFALDLPEKRLSLFTVELQDEGGVWDLISVILFHLQLFPELSGIGQFPAEKTDEISVGADSGLFFAVEEPYPNLPQAQTLPFSRIQIEDIPIPMSHGPSHGPNKRISSKLSLGIDHTKQAAHICSPGSN